MDAFNFINFLKNPAHLHQVTFQEINNLIEQYPFCQNLHYLALRKAQYENHKDFVKKLELAATYSPNRQWLYKQLQEIPVASSDEKQLVEAEQLEEVTEKESTANSPEIALDETTEANIPAPVYYKEVEPEEETIDPAIEEDIDQLAEEIAGSTPPFDENLADDPIVETTLEHFTNNTNNTPSHSISDSDDLPIPIELTDELDVNLENSEDMKLPDYKDKKVIFMEDLVDEVPPIEEAPEIVEINDELNNTITNDFIDPIEEEAEPEVIEESSMVSDSQQIEFASSNIPFEVYIPQEETEEETEEEFDEIPSEAEAPEGDAHSELEPEEDTEDENHNIDEELELLLQDDSEHLVDADTEQLAQPAYPSDSIENKPIAAMNLNDEEEDDLHIEENEEENDEEEEITDEISEDGEPEKPAQVGPMPKSAFSSWRQKKAIAPLKKKKEKKKKQKSNKVIEVPDLFKKEKKEKKKKKGKNSKKKNTKRFAMESLLEHEDVVSETLAEIVAEQGRKKKALKMYKRLIKMHPEKAAIYLNRIEEIKKMD